MIRREDLALFLSTHEVDSVYDEPGCETCGPEYTINCHCGKSYDYIPEYNRHVQDMVESWIGPSASEITKP